MPDLRALFARLPKEEPPALGVASAEDAQVALMGRWLADRLRLPWSR